MSTTKDYPEIPGKKRIFTTRFWHKRAKRYIYAHEYGKQVFCFYVDI